MPRTFPANWSNLNVALSHDWLTGMRGGERVLELLCDGFPRAPLNTLIHNPAAVSEAINRHRITTSVLQHLPGIIKWYRYFLPFFPTAMRMMPVADADLLISTSHCAAKGLRTRPGAKHLCYCFTPMRYAWTFHDEYFGRNPLKRALLTPLLEYLQNWDRKASDRVDRFVAISQYVRRRIRIFYGRDADVVYPPVDTDFFTPGDGGRHAVAAKTGSSGDFDLIVSALVPYKRLDLAIEAYNHYGYPLKIVGAGTERKTLEFLAESNIEFLGWLPDDQVRDLYRSCRLLVFPGIEDFGLVPIEAQSCGKPVVAFDRGGVTESVVHDETGILFEEQTENGLISAVEKCAARTWDPAAIRRNAERFGVQAFLDGLAVSIDKCLRGEKT